MNGKIAVVLLSGLLFGCVQPQPPVAIAPPPPAPAPPSAPAPVAAAPAVPADRIVVIRRAGCGDLLRLDDEDRTVASMFYIGYQAARFGDRTINVSKVPTIKALALSYCQAYGDASVAEAFAQAYRYGRR